MKTIFTSALMASTILLSGCGSDSSSADSAVTSVQVERGPILGAVVVDNDGRQATQNDDAVASYTFETPPTYPISAYGGYIDVNRNGVIDAGEVENTIILKAKSGEVLTLLTSILSVVDENTSSFFLDDLGLNDALTPTEDLNVSALSDVMYEYLIENNLTNIDENTSSSAMAQLKELVKLKIKKYNDDDLNASAQEEILVLKLEIKKLDDADADAANLKITGQENAANIIANLPNMSDEQKAKVIAKIKKNADKKKKGDEPDSFDEIDSDDNDSSDEIDSIDDDSTDNNSADNNSTN